MLEGVDLVAGYGKLAVLHGVSITVAEGEIVAVVGPNGAGKSTLLKVLARQLPVIQGTLRLRGENYTNKDSIWVARQGIALVPQTNNVFPDLTVEENLKVGAWRHPNSPEGIREAQDRFPILRERSRQLAGRLSGGERQILAISCALLTRPSVLLLDEPSTGLSPIAADVVIEWTSEIVQRGTAIVWVVEQMPEPVLQRANRAYVMEGGGVQYAGSAEFLLAEGRLQELLLRRSAPAR
ncbi:MAG: ABC transporter ATP-binding protein [Candidatus Acidiferrales bacterium]